MKKFVLLLALIMSMTLIPVQADTKLPIWEVKKAEYTTEKVPVYLAEYDATAKDGFKTEKLLNNGAPVAILEAAEHVNAVTIAKEFWEGNKNLYRDKFHPIKPFAEAVKELVTTVAIIEDKVTPASDEEVKEYSTLLGEINVLKDDIKALEELGDEATEEDKEKLARKRELLKEKTARAEELLKVIKEGHVEKVIVNQEQRAVLILVENKYETVILCHHIHFGEIEVGTVEERLELEKSAIYDADYLPILDIQKLASIKDYKGKKVEFVEKYSVYDGGYKYNPLTMTYDKTPLILHLFYMGEDIKVAEEVIESKVDAASAPVPPVYPAVVSALPATGEAGTVLMAKTSYGLMGILTALIAIAGALYYKKQKDTK